MIDLIPDFFSVANHKAFSGKAFPAGATRFASAFKAGTRAQTIAPSGLFENLFAFL